MNIKTPNRLWSVAAALTTILCQIVCCPVAHASYPTAERALDNESEIVGGLRTIRLDDRSGKFRIYLPEDIRVGDFISASLSYEPKGPLTEAEIARLLDSFSLVKIEARFADTGARPLDLGIGKDRFMRSFSVNLQNATAPLTLDLTGKDGASFGAVQVPIGPRQPLMADLPVVRHLFPAFGQPGRPLEIIGPFDGNAANTDVAVGKIPAQVLVESPRLLVVRSPAENLGVSNILVRDGGRQISGTYRNIGVGLSAAKLNLLKGESTTMTVQVTGLAGIRTEVPLWLVKAGTVVMEGGDFQHLMIKPSEVRGDGTYQTTRKLTGLVAGTFGVVATVIDPTIRPIIIPLIQGGQVNGFKITPDGSGARFEVEGVRDPVTGKLLDGSHKLVSDCKVPVLSKLPVMSMLFRNGNARTEKQQCLIFITPRIVKTDE